ncbi:MAG: right-handed parallel beta-helix repeat-containing protein, partial [Sphingobacterium sp.]
VENVSIFNANIEGDYSKHLGKEGQWGYGIDIRGSRNIKISNCIISNCWGDGLVISSNPNKFTNNVKLFNTNNVTIERAVIDYNRRNGITIAGGENVIIRNSLISNTFGTQPKAGIDFEPDNSKPKMEGIYLENITFFNNASGINFYLNSYADKSVRKNIGIKLNNLVFEDQIMALVIYGFDQKIKKQALTGLVEVSGVKLKNVNKPIFRGADNHRIIPQFSIRNWNSAAKTMSKNELLKDVKNPIGLDIK